jgi:hypothetical protein
MKRLQVRQRPPFISCGPLVEALSRYIPACEAGDAPRFSIYDATVISPRQRVHAFLGGVGIVPAKLP